MSIIPPIGALCLGIVMGWLVRYFIRRFEGYTPQTLSSVVSIIAGGLIIKVFEADKTVWWFYPIGLFLGFVFYTVVVIKYGGTKEPGTLFGIKRKKSESQEKENK